jgi:predicted PurR-regulated permease PerM
VTARERDGGAPLAFVWKVAVVAAAAVVLWLLYLARRGIVVVYLSVLLAVALSPVVRLAERYTLRPIGRLRLPRPLAILIVYLAILGAVVGVVWVVATPIAAQAQDLTRDFPRLLDRGQSFLVEHGVITHPLGWQDVVQRARSAGIVGTVTSTSLDLVAGLFAAIVLVFLTFYLLVETDLLFDEALRFFPVHRRAVVKEAAIAVTHKVSAWLGGHLLLGAMLGSLTALGLGLLGIPYFYVLAVMSAVAEFVPYFGALIVSAIGIALAVGISFVKAIAVTAFFVVEYQIEAHVLVPQVFERQVGLSAATVIVALVLGGEVLGLLGIVLAVPTAAIIQVVLRETVLKDR